MLHPRLWRTFFDKLAKNDSVGLDSKLQDIVFRAFISKIDNIDNKRIITLDAGSGKCDFNVFLKNNHIENVDVVSVDISREMINKCKIMCKNAIVGDISRLPFRNNVFDYVISSDTLQYVNKKKTILEFIRILKSTGVIIVSCPNTHHPVIKNVEEKWGRKYKGLDINTFLIWLHKLKVIKKISIKPIFYDNGRYWSTEFVDYKKYYEKEIPNRYVISMEVDK